MYLVKVIQSYVHNNFLSGGLNKLFEKQKCILEYMTTFSDLKECIFRNYTVMFLHVFKGLEYLHSRKIVHGDVKGFDNTVLHISNTTLARLKFGWKNVCITTADMRQYV